jgi:membrane-bound serine protease (ClpP class)
VALAFPIIRTAAQEEAQPEAVSGRTEVVHLVLDSIIHPVAEEMVRQAIEEGEARHAAAIVIELSTPGGLLPSTRSIGTAMLETDLPIVVFVSPRGAQAASAGFFILMAADIAAMAPGTNTGAAHPIAGTGQDIPGTLGEKVEQDSAALMRSYATQRGRNVELAEAAVLESRSFTAQEALEGNLIELIAEDMNDLLAKLDGRLVEKNESQIEIASLDASLIEVEMTAFQSLRSILVNPNVAMALGSIGATAIMIELYSPGAILPGVVGAICLILAGYSMSVLPVSGTGIALIVLAALLFGLEIKVQSFGVLTAGGIVCLVLGSLFLFRTPDPAIRVSLQMIAAIAVVCAGMAVLMMLTVFKVHKTQVSTGREGLVHERGIARSALDPRGKVLVHGEIWDAVARTNVVEGQEIEVESVEGLTLTIKPVQS